MTAMRAVLMHLFMTNVGVILSITDFNEYTAYCVFIFDLVSFV